MKRVAPAVLVSLLSFALSAVQATHASPPATAILAGGCFWCVEHDFQSLEGVTDVMSGYSGGNRLNPTYQNYNDTDSAHPVPHVEVVQITYEPEKLSYEKLLSFYFRHIDPTDGEGQFCDRGAAYRPVIFVETDAERGMAEAEKSEAAKLIAQPVVVDILPAQQFWPAEVYHQDYAARNPVRYKYYRWNCGRDSRIEKIWGGEKTSTPAID